MRILEEFWYGNIEPTEYDTSSCKEQKLFFVESCIVVRRQSKKKLRLAQKSYIHSVWPC